MWESQNLKLAHSLAYRVKNFGASKNNLTKLVHVVCREAGIKIWIPFFYVGGGCTLKICGRTNQRDFGQF